MSIVLFLRNIRSLVGGLGLAGLWCKVNYEFQKRTGLMRRRFPTRAWRENGLEHWIAVGGPVDAEGYALQRLSGSQRFFWMPELQDEYQHCLWVLLGDSRSKVVEEADQFRSGVFRYFSRLEAALGNPPDWHQNPFTGQRTPSDRHWSDFPGCSSEFGDIKLIWEPSRFSAAYTLVRAYWLTDDEDYPRAFWELVKSWRGANPPQLGVNWRCGQEAAFRVMAWCFALYGFASSIHTTPERVAMLAAMIAAHADRIERNIGYARSQKNNHAISEGTGLWTVGLLFPEFRAAERWREKGRQVLKEEACRQIHDDGSYVQHSTNYHRLMLHDYLWAIRLGDLNGQPLSHELRRRVGQATEFLYQLQDEDSGQVPNYGANDGAMILPLNTCDYTDFRPVLNAVHYLCHGERLYPPGPWDEDLLWLFGPKALDTPAGSPARGSLAASVGGYYTLRGARSFGFIRCATYRDRPGQADMLHFDLWWHGINVACDAGTYGYTSVPPWNNALASTAVHNTVTVDGQDQMQRGPRFLWFDWTHSRVRCLAESAGGHLEYFEGEHDGYHRLGVTHRRAVLRAGDDLWLVADDLLGQGEHTLCLQWLLPDLPYTLDEEAGQLLLQSPQGPFSIRVWCSQLGIFRLIRGGEPVSSALPSPSAPSLTLRGWRSLYYAYKEPALSLSLDAIARLPVRFLTLLIPGDRVKVDWDLGNVTIQAKDNSHLTVALAFPSISPILAQASLNLGDSNERLLPYHS